MPSAHGVTADRASGAIYVATDAGVFYHRNRSMDRPAGRATWTSLSENLPAAAAMDVKLDAGGNQIYAALDGYGVYTAIAPHRLRDARVVSAADYSARPAAPGALLSVLGARVESATSDDVVAPVLDASDTRVADSSAVFGQRKYGVVVADCAQRARCCFRSSACSSVSPAIFVDPEGTPLIMDAASGSLARCQQTGARQFANSGAGDGPGPGETGLAHWPAGAVEGPAASGRHSARLYGRTRRWR